MAAIAVDTNVLVRLATGDSPVEHAAATTLMADGAVFIATTVLLETEWVLRSRYGYSRAQFLEFARWLLRSPEMEFDSRKSVHAALDLHAAGFDFADAVHVVSAAGRPFATFDRTLLRRAHARGTPLHAMKK